jgi:serine protease DegS
MPARSLQRNVLFIGVSIAAGVLIAILVSRLWPQLVHGSAPPAADVSPVPGPDTVPAALPPPQATLASETDELRPSPAGEREDSSATISERMSGVTQDSFAPAVRAAAPAVVSVYVQRTERLPIAVLDPFDPTRQRYRERILEGLGSGVIVDDRGHIVTNHHVIAGSDRISVELADGRRTPATVVGRDPGTDLAVLKIDLPKLPVMTLGRSDRIAVGDVVLAIGTPLGLSQTVTHGIISAIGRAQLGVAVYENFIQTDAAISVGNSGGALVNTRGELVGINTAVLGKNLGAEGIGVAIPVDLVRGVMREILQHGRVIRGWIGIVVDEINEAELREVTLPHAGVVISNLYRNSPALEVGLARGDMIETVNGAAVRSARDALARIASNKPGSTVTITGVRGQQRFSVKVPVVEPPVQAQGR